jgi:dimethylhistidine N-methyltransferase
MHRTTTISPIALEVIEGLKSTPKKISSKFFYDGEGSRIFQQIMSMPEYYLARSEAEIFETYKEDLVSLLCMDCCSVDLVELGAGDGAKTRILIEELLSKETHFRYIPIDISEDAVLQLAGAMKLKFPDLKLEPRIGDYFHMLENLSHEYPNRKVLMFLGSNLGNFDYRQSISFLSGLRKVMSEGDLFFIGLDLIKDQEIIRKAYNDPHGYTRDFNLNLLHRFNRELGADFDTNAFIHAPRYDPESGTASSSLVSTKDQSVFFQESQETIFFKEGEAIHTEISQKYDLDTINELAAASGFEVARNFFDSRRYFVSSLWKAAKSAS